MNDYDDSIVDSLPVEVLLEINRICLEFERAWQAGNSPRIKDFAARMPRDAYDAGLRELIAQEVDLRWAAGQSAEPEEYHQRFPQHTEAVNAGFALLEGRRPSAGQIADTESFLVDDAPETDHNRQPAAPTPGEPPPAQRLGRFEIERRLGRGAFGDVYLAYDPHLNRRVALKVPRQERFSSPAEMDGFAELPVGVITAICGAPVFIYLLHRKGGAR